MEKRITVLEVLAQQHTKSIDRLDRSIADLRADMDRRFSEVGRVQHEFRADVDRRFCEVNRTQQDFRADVDRKICLGDRHAVYELDRSSWCNRQTCQLVLDLQSKKIAP